MHEKNPRTDARPRIIEALAEEGHLNMWKIKEQKKLFYSTVHKAVDALQEEGLIRQVKQMKTVKGGNTMLFGLTFRGFVRHLALHPDLSFPSGVGKANEDVEGFKRRHARERSMFLKNVESLARMVKHQGDLLDYTLFKECGVLADYVGLRVYQDFLDVARFVDAYSPFPFNATQLVDSLKRELQRLEKKKESLMANKQMIADILADASGESSRIEEFKFDPVREVDERIREKTEWLRTLRSREDDWWRRGFAEQLFQRIVGFHEAKMPNRNLRIFAKELLRKKRELETDVLEKAVELFSE